MNTNSVRIAFILPLSIFLVAASAVAIGQGLPVSTCSTAAASGVKYSKGPELEEALQEVVRNGVPGVAMAVYSDEGWWTSTKGLARIDGQIPMLPCHLQYLQSVSKTYLAVGVLKLFEDGRIELDAPLTRYLPQEYGRYLVRPEAITIRMLLNHTSGVPEYNMVPAYVTKLLQHPDHVFSGEDYLKYIDGKQPDFTPGSRYSYRNTNYVILAFIVDAITGDHARYLSEVIFKPLRLGNTYYRNEPGYLTYTSIVNSYWDRHSNSIIENVSVLQRNNVACLIGDDGIVASPEDAVQFLKGLIEGKLLKESTLEIMKTWVKDRKGNDTYGLGLDFNLFLGHAAVGHSGGGIGAGCQLYYFPERNLYFFIAINLGTVTDSPLHTAASKTLDKIYGVLLR